MQPPATHTHTHTHIHTQHTHIYFHYWPQVDSALPVYCYNAANHWESVCICSHRDTLMAQTVIHTNTYTVAGVLWSNRRSRKKKNTHLLNCSNDMKQKCLCLLNVAACDMSLSLSRLSSKTHALTDTVACALSIADGWTQSVPFLQKISTDQWDSVYLKWSPKVWDHTESISFFFSTYEDIFRFCTRLFLDH